MKKTCFAAIFLATLITLPSVVSASNDTSTQVTGEGESSCTVSAHVTSDYYVSLPATLTLVKNQQTGKYENTYYVGVKGSISEGKYVEVVPDYSFSLRKTGTSKSYSARVSQGVTKWKKTKSASDEIAINATSFSTTTGKVEVSLPSDPGDYSGSFTFRYSLK